MRRAILIGGLVAGALDIAFACTFAYVRAGVPPAAVGRFIASGLLGSAAKGGGAAIVALGFALHFVIALGAATVFVLASRKIRLMTEQPFVAGPIFGVCVYLVMNFVVRPLSLVPPWKWNAVGVPLDLASHVFFVGTVIALATRRWAQSRTESPISVAVPGATKNVSAPAPPDTVS
jgi:hypothetical protein